MYKRQILFEKDFYKSLNCEVQCLCEHTKYEAAAKDLVEKINARYRIKGGLSKVEAVGGKNQPRPLKPGNGGIVVGTGNKVEDYGVGFFTKYGDGAVDIAPIADLYKSEVWELGEYLEVDQAIVDAPPTDGLWDDQRTDEDQLGATYEQLEEAMENGTGPGVDVLKYYNEMNQH